MTLIKIPMHKLTSVYKLVEFWNNLIFFSGILAIEGRAKSKYLPHECPKVVLMPQGRIISEWEE